MPSELYERSIQNEPVYTPGLSLDLSVLKGMIFLSGIGNLSLVSNGITGASGLGSRFTVDSGTLGVWLSATLVLEKATPGEIRASGTGEGDPRVVSLGAEHASPGTVALVDGKELVTSYRSPSELSVSLPAEMVRRPAAFPLP